MYISPRAEILHGGEVPLTPPPSPQLKTVFHDYHDNIIIQFYILFLITSVREPQNLILHYLIVCLHTTHTPPSPKRSALSSSTTKGNISE